MEPVRHPRPSTHIARNRVRWEPDLFKTVDFDFNARCLQYRAQQGELLSTGVRQQIVLLEEGVLQLGQGEELIQRFELPVEPIVAVYNFSDDRGFRCAICHRILGMSVA